MRLLHFSPKPLALAVSAAFILAGCAASRPAPTAAVHPWTNTALSPDARADLLGAQMTEDEKWRLIRTYYGTAKKWGKHPTPTPDGALGSAGYMPAIARLGIPALQETDAGVGVANPDHARPGDTATALPSELAVAASFDPDLAYAGGAMIGSEAAAKGFNVMLAGGATLERDPRNGRNFEYAGEDPLLTGETAGALIRGVESNHIISTIKHFAVNAMETGRNVASATIDEDAMRESDLLAFEIAIARADPGSVMCGYNLVNGEYDCENDFLLNTVLKKDWGYPGFVMSDWGGTHSGAKAANAGLDQESAGESFDAKVWFDAPLRQALASGEFKPARLNDMAHRVLRSMFAKGLFDYPTKAHPIDAAANEAIAQRVAEGGAVLLRNVRGTLPLSANVKRIAVIGGHADVGVMAGGGSSEVIPRGGNAVNGEGPAGFPGPVIYDPSSPLKAIQAAAPDADVTYLDGSDPDAAAKLAARSDVVVVFAPKWAAESLDAKDLRLPNDQDTLIDTVARANRHTVVVLETGNPVLTPWLAHTGAVLEAWYPGQRGGEAIANLLFGAVNPAGRLPMTWPTALAQLPRPDVKGVGEPHPGSNPGGQKPGEDPAVPLTIDYNVEGADVGYRWFERQHERPLFPFGFGLSYSHFTYSGLHSDIRDGQVHVIFDVHNVSKRAGADIPQIYATLPEKGQVRRLVGWKKVNLAAGETQTVDLVPATLPLSRFDVNAQQWHQLPGQYTFALGHSSSDLVARTVIVLPDAFPAAH